ncbi:protein HEXIM2 [Chelonus insularis]|uniref:protein HEXIM2 n=1 Tax=Chelonus insularis TaxID=460826 RepID=UPI00158B52D0|nr:protein HEXIM2 [Chelonus insularis]
MDISVTQNQRTIFSATNMDTIEPQGLQENRVNNINNVKIPKGVEADPTPPAAMEETTAAQSADEEMELSSRSDNCIKDRETFLVMNSRKFESGSGSGEACHAEDGADILAKKRKTRRGKPKHRKLKPYSKQPSYQQRLRCRANGRQLKKSNQPTAPYNTTQFLMEDHSDLPDLEQKLAVVATSEVPKLFQKPLAPPRTRDSSFSIDSDEDYFYSSPEDEEEFLTKEFSSAYEDLHAERLSMLSKSELIQEYIQLEAKLDLLTKRLRSKNFQQTEEKEADGKTNGTTSCMSESEMAKKLKICQQTIDDLMQQNDQLTRDLEALRGKGRKSSVSSVDSESDSDSDSSSSCSCSDGNGSSSYQSARRSMEQRIGSRVTASSTGDTTSSKDNSSSSPSGNPEMNNTDLVNGSVSNQDVAELPT